MQTIGSEMPEKVELSGGEESVGKGLEGPRRSLIEEETRNPLEEGAQNWSETRLRNEKTAQRRLIFIGTDITRTSEGFHP